MTGVAIALLVVALLVVWGGLVASVVYLARQPSLESDGGVDDDLPIVLHDL